MIKRYGWREQPGDIAAAIHGERQGDNLPHKRFSHVNAGQHGVNAYCIHITRRRWGQRQHCNSQRCALKVLLLLERRLWNAHRDRIYAECAGQIGVEHGLMGEYRVLHTIQHLNSCLRFPVILLAKTVERWVSNAQVGCARAVKDFYGEDKRFVEERRAV